MGMLDGLFGKKDETMPPEKLEKEMGNVDNTPVPESADFYVVRVDIGPDGNTKPVTRAMAPDKIIFTNLSALSKNPEKSGEVVKVLKAHAHRSGGSIALVSPDLLLITPPRIGIRKGEPPEEKNAEQGYAAAPSTR